MAKFKVCDEVDKIPNEPTNYRVHLARYFSDFSGEPKETVFSRVMSPATLSLNII